MTLFATILDCTFNLQLFSIALLQEAVIYCVRHHCFIKLTGFNQELILRLIYLWIKSLYDLIVFGMLFIVSGTIVFSNHSI